MAGRGSIKKREGPRGVAYRVRVEYPRDPATGRREQHAKTFHTKKAAESALTKWLADVQRGVQIDPDTVTVSELLHIWLDTIAAPKVDATTLHGYRRTIDYHLIPALGAIQVQKLTKARVQQFYADKRAAGVGARTLELCHGRLSQALRHAVNVWEIIPSNVCDKVEPPKSVPKRGGAWTQDEAQRFMAVAARDHYWPYWLVVLATGMRRGEALGLRWQDIDLARGLLVVTQQVVTVGGKTFVKPDAKSDAGRRAIKVPDEVIAALVAHKGKQDAMRRKVATWEEHDLVFCSRNGKPIIPAKVLAAAHRLCKDAGVPDMRVHGLRHTHATWLIMSGRPLPEVAQRLGHKKPSITLDVYAHVLPHAQDASSNVMRDILFRRDPKASVDER